MEFRLAAASCCKLHSRILWWHKFVSSPPSSCSLGFSMTQICIKPSSSHLQSWILDVAFLCQINIRDCNFMRDDMFFFVNKKKSETATSWGKTHFCVIINQSMQFPWRLKNWLMALPISYLSTWVLDNKTTLGWGNRHILAALNFNCWNFQPQNLSTSSQECLFSHQF